jgi:AcrR family transcriptional regulator
MLVKIDKKNLTTMLERAGISAVVELALAHPELPPRASRKVGRPKAQSSDSTRERILFEAEKLFAARGYDGTSIRDVASACECQIQSIGYHFGQKDQLFDTVISRRAKIMNTIRETALTSLRASAGHGVLPVEYLVRAYVSPFIASANSGDEGWRNYAALMGRLANSKLGTDTIARHYNEMAKSYIAEFRRSLPKASEASIINGMLYMVASMLAICADTGRASQLSENLNIDGIEQPRADNELERLVTFVVAGFRALEQSDMSAA